MQIRDVILRQQSKFETKQDRQMFRRAVLTTEGGLQTSSDPLNDVWANRNERRVWHMADGATQPAQVLCRKVSNPYVGLGVIIGYADGSNAKEVLTTDFFLTGAGTNLDGWDDTGPEDLEPGGNKLHWIYTKVITPLATYPDPTGLTVNVISGDYPYLGTRKTFAGSVAYALTQNPNPGEHYLAGLYLDAANTLQVVYGTSVSTAVTAPEPSWPAGAFRLSVVLIDDVQTSIDFDTDIFDRRMAWSDEEAGAENAWPIPGKVQIGATEYASIGAAITAASAGDTLYAAGAFTENVTLNKAIRLVGLGRGAFSIAGTVTISDAGAVFENSTVTATSGTGAVICSVGATMISIIASHSGGTDAKAFNITGNDALLIECKGTASGASTTNRGLYVNATGVKDFRGDYSGSGTGNVDVYVDGGNSLACADTVVTNAGTTSGTIYGTLLQRSNGLVNIPPAGQVIFYSGAGLYFLGSGGASQYVKQLSANGALTVGTIATADLPALPSASETVSGAAEIATQAETDTGTDDQRIVTPLKLATAKNVFTTNYVILPTVGSNDLTVTLKTLSGGNPSATDPVVARIGDTVAKITSTLSTTKAAGTNWFNSGAAAAAGGLATNAIDYFVYLINETGASAGTKIGFARIPWATTMGNFTNTTTSEKYIAGSWTNFNATDEVTVIGRFRATLSGTAAFNWSAAGTVINYPIFETAWLTNSPGVTSQTNTITTVGTVTSTYQVVGRNFFCLHDITITTVGTAGGSVIVQLPFTTAGLSIGPGRERGVAGKMLQVILNGADARYLNYDNSTPFGAGNGMIVTGGGVAVRLV